MEYKQWLDIRLLQISIENKRTFFLSFDLVQSRVVVLPLMIYAKDFQKPGKYKAQGNGVDEQ
jgi:hypothetical protein